MDFIQEPSLTADEAKRLRQLDSLRFSQFCLPNALDCCTPADRTLLFKAHRVLENKLFELHEDDKGNVGQLFECYFKLGHVQLLAQDYAKALSAYQKAYNLDKERFWKQPSGYYGLGLVYFHFRAYQFAADAFQRLLFSHAHFEHAHEVHARLGLIYKAIENFPLALKHLNLALLNSRTCVLLSRSELRFHIAHCYDCAGELQRAYNEYRILLDDHANANELTQSVRAAILRQLGWICYRTGTDEHQSSAELKSQKLYEADQYLTQSRELEPACGKTYYYLGRCYGELPERAHDAFTNYRHSIDKSEADADTWCSIGVLYQQQMQPMDALQAFICAVQLDSEHSAAWTDLGRLYEEKCQFDDALHCFRNAVKHRPAAPEALKARIQVLEKELSSATTAANRPPNSARLPSLHEAWKLPIPAELTQRQDDFLKVANRNGKYRNAISYLQQKYQRYRDGSALWTMPEIAAIVPPSSTATNGVMKREELDTTQIQMMQLLQLNKDRLQASERYVLEQLEQKHAVAATSEPTRCAVNGGPAGHTVHRISADSGLPLVSQDDIFDVLGTTVQIKTEKPDADLLAVLPAPNAGESPAHDATSSTSAVPGGNATSTSGGGGNTMQASSSSSAGGAPRNVQEESISSTCSEPPPFSLQAPVHVPISIASQQLLELCKKRCDAPAQYTPIFDERVRPPVPPAAPKPPVPVDKLLRPTPLILVDSRRDANAFELQNFCFSTPICLIRGMTGTLKMDLSVFSTKSLLETAPEHEVEVRTQYRMPPDVNVDHLGQPTWACHSTRSFTSVAKYAHYQAQSFQHSLKEEQEKLRLTGGKYSLSDSSSGEAYFGKRRRIAGLSDPPPAIDAMPTKIIKFGTNVDLSDEIKFRAQLYELSKMPSFCRLVSASNMLTHLGHTVLGMNTVQMYMKVPGSRTPGHQENNSLASINVNIGPGECEWFGVPYEYWGVIESLCRKRGLDFLKGAWWPNLEDLLTESVPIYRFTQKAGDVVWINGGCVHWVQATGWCNNVAWNVGPMSNAQMQVALSSHEWNRLQGYKSLVPMQHLSWQLAKNVRFTNPALYKTLKEVLIRSLAYCKMIADYLQSIGKAVKMHPRAKGEVAHYCSACEIEVFNILFVREQNSKFLVYCVDCCRRSGASMEDFIVLQQTPFEELARVFDDCQLHQV